MDKREDALNEALLTNTNETQRWQTYLKDNETAIENLSMFCKRLTVDVMVPVGNKAFMPGHLLHTNEVLVGHYQGYFSKCTTFKAKEICERRIKMAKEHLEKLEMESEFWQYKLDIPHAEGVMPRGEEREIIEEYNEENEKLWKEQHRIKLREAKLKEREERENDLQQREQPNQNKDQVEFDEVNELINSFEELMAQTNEKDKINKESESKVMSEEERDRDQNELEAKVKSEQEVFKLLDEAELMEELEQELDKLEVDEINDETIRKLMSGEMKLPEERKRLPRSTAKEEERNLDDAVKLNNIVKKNDMWNTKVLATNNNVQPNPELLSQYLNSNEVEEIDEEREPKEVTMIKEQAQFLNAENQIGFYEYQIQIIRQKILVLPLRTQEELDEKIRLLNILEHLEEQLELAEETVGAEELAEKDEAIEENEEKTEINLEETSGNPKEDKKKSSISIKQTKSMEKRHISFALEDQTLEFRKHETIKEMLPLKPDMITRQRDIIKLNDEDETTNIIDPPTYKIDKNKSIQIKVERNLQYVSENQSKQDFDLVQQILQKSMGKMNTLYIKFKHSEQEMTPKDNKEPSDVPGSPADFYDLYIKSQESLEESVPSTLFINSYEGEDQVKTPVLKEVDRQEAFTNPKSEFSNPSLQAKSILRNKSAVDKENHQTDVQHENISKNKKSKKKSKSKQEDECFSAYNKVMKDVVEKPVLTEPEPLPDVKFIDAHTPKKRISRFKQMRQGSENI